VLNRLPALHDPYNSSPSLDMSIRGHTFMRLFALGLGLFELNLVNLDAVFGVVEARVEGESVGVGDVAAFGGLS
jgi:hypothetical protein